jgi:hypothetical protein
MRDRFFSGHYIFDDRSSKRFLVLAMNCATATARAKLFLASGTVELTLIVVLD